MTVMGYNIGMGSRESDRAYKRKIQTLLIHNAAINRSELARVVGVTPQAVTQFESNLSSLGIETVKMIDEYLKGVLAAPKDIAAMEAPASGGPFREVVLDVRALLAILESDRFSDGEKTQRLEAFIRFYTPLLDKFDVATETGKQ